MTKPTKPRTIPYFTRTRQPNLSVGASGSLEHHLLEIFALEALASGLSPESENSAWTTSVEKRIGRDALSFGIFRGRVAPHPETGAPEPEIAVDRGAGLSGFVELGFFDGFGPAADPWPDDEVALGVNFSRLHRLARLIESRAPDFLEMLKARILEDVRSNAIYSELRTAAERRAERAEQECALADAKWREEQAAREEVWRQAREIRRQKDLDFKRRIAALFGVDFPTDEALDAGVQVKTNTTGKGYENAFGVPMPAEHAAHAPFVWGRVGSAGKRVFFDALGRQIPEPI